MWARLGSRKHWIDLLQLRYAMTADDARTPMDRRLGKAKEHGRAAPAGASFRQAIEADTAFFHILYGTTRSEELAATGWPEDVIAAFLFQQATAQQSHYARHYADAEWWVLEEAGVPIGRLILAPAAHEYRIVDIALLPEARGRGIGTAIIRDVLAEAQAAGAKVSIHVEKTNPARRLYLRLGFAMVEDKGIYDLMEGGHVPEQKLAKATLELAACRRDGVS